MPDIKNKTKQRNVFLTANKYQEKIILLSFVPSALIFTAFILIVFIGNPILSKAAFKVSSSEAINMVYMYSGAMVVLLCSIIFVAIILSFLISHHLVGAFGRIIKEMDDIIDGKSERKITSRPGDALAEEFLSRINVLADFYIKHKNK